jgi:hypothetical protein
LPDPFSSAPQPKAALIAITGHKASATAHFALGNLVVWFTLSSGFAAIIPSGFDGRFGDFSSVGCSYP